MKIAIFLCAVQPALQNPKLFNLLSYNDNKKQQILTFNRPFKDLLIFKIIFFSIKDSTYSFIF